MKYQVTKTYGHELGLSVCFRQWRAESHCRFLHGYALAFEFVFESQELDDRGWVIDFGVLGKLKEWLVRTFDHKLIVAGDDPFIHYIGYLEHTTKIAELTVLPLGVGCERFAEHAYDHAALFISQLALKNKVRVVSCKCSEHGANSATYYG